MTVAPDLLRLERFLRVAVEAARALAVHHASKGVHGALTPGWLAGGSPRASLDAWAYKSPEQTGRLRRPVDERSDLYVIGVVLYEALTGALPFTAADPLEWAHRHLAMPPRPPRELDSTIPEAVERIVLRLLAKDPDERYQTAAGLLFDLERCLERWEEGRAIVPFALGERDRPDRLKIPEKLYGRERERGILLDALGAVCEQAGPRLVTVGGPAGIGKSTLVRELATPVAAAGGHLVAGKFEDAPQGTLYGALMSGFNELMALILGGSESALAGWRARLRAAVGPNARVLADALPQLELVLGPLPPVPPLPPTEARYRFASAFRGFVDVFATAEHPLVLALDDVQWAGAASLRLIGDLVTEGSLRSLLVVVAHRDDRPPGEALSDMLDDLRGAGTPVESMTLGPLKPEALTHLLADVLGMPPAVCEPLQATLYSKSAGNPLFFGQLVLDLQRVGLLRLDREGLEWSWNVEAVAGYAVGEDVVDLLTKRLLDCAPQMQRTLSLAACLGGGFDPGLVAAASGSERDETAAVIDGAVGAGLLTRLPDGYRFSHDRVREVAYAALPEERRPATHLLLGRALLAAGADVSEAVAQLDRGRSAIEHTGERRELARLNLVAAQRARSAAAFDVLAEYCGAGLELLGTDAWAGDRELAFGLTLERAEAELFAGHLHEAEQLLASAIANAQGRLERLRCAGSFVALKTATGAVVEGVTYVVEVMRSFGVELSLHPTNAEEAERALRERLGATWERTLLELPRGEDPEVEALLDVLARTTPPAVFVDRELFHLMLYAVVDRTLDCGVYPGSVWALAAYAFVRGAVGDVADADRFADVALQLTERHELRTHRSGVHSLLASSLRTPVASAVDLAREGVRLGIENGEIHNAAYCCVLVCFGQLVAGAPLAEVERDAGAGLEVARRVHLAGEAANLVLIRQLARALRGRTDGLSSLTDQDFDQAALDDALERNAPVGLHWWYRVYLMQAQVLNGEFTEALATREAFEADLPSLRGASLESEAEFYAGLAVAGAEPEVRDAQLDRLRERVQRLATWAQACPENFAARGALLAGELARVEERPVEALEQFARAVARAQAAGSVHIEAMAHESAARVCRELRRDRQAGRHLRDAVACYREWGALAKATQLEQAHTVPGAEGGQVDALAVARAAQAISEELEHERVLERLLATAIMQAGARGGQLLLFDAGEAVVAATAERSEQGIAVTLHEPPRPISGEIVATSVVHYVTRTRQPLILGDAREGRPFAVDPYITRRHVRSLLCVPMLAQGDLHGLLCLENDLIPDVFTADRLAALDVIAAQAVISLENVHARERFRAVADEQSRLHRLAELVAGGVDPQIIFDTVCEETAQLVGAAVINLVRFIDEDSSLIVAGWSEGHRHLPRGMELHDGPDTVTGRVRATRAPARVDTYDNAESELGVLMRERGIRSSVGAPIVIDNKVWGALNAATDRPVPAPPQAEERLTRVAGLIATAVSNASARSALIASRARILTAGDQARRRLERDLHDGAQQRLVSLGLQLQALGYLIPPEATEAHEELERLRHETVAVFEHIRQISRGLHPAALSHERLRPALAGLARTSPIPVELTVEGDARLPETLKTCIYYVVSECLTNAAKYSGADHVSVSVNRTGDTLHARIDDDGRGGADPATGSGLIGLIDRVDAVGGRLTLDSTPDQGTHVAVDLPITQYNDDRR